MQDQWVLHEGEILEYCESDKCLEREQYYIDLLIKEYNILKRAGSRLGSLHTKETRAKMKGRKLFEETRAKMSKSKKGLQAGDKNPMFGKKHSNETRTKISSFHKGKN